MSRSAGKPRARTEATDAHVGAQIRARRLELGLTQAQLAGQIGIRHQQLQRYEVGINRITSGTLFLIARALGVDLAYFFPAPPPQAWLPPGVQQAQGVALRLEELAQSFRRIANPQHQEALCYLARVLANRPGDDAG